MIRGAVIAAFVLMMPAMALAERVSVGKGAMLRGLDKVTGVVEDLQVMNGDVVRMGRILIALGECRYPEDNSVVAGFGIIANDRVWPSTGAKDVMM